MTSCVLYGLALSKLLQGSVFTSVRAGRRARDHIRQMAAGYVALSLLPTFGIILSVTAINKMFAHDVGFGWHVFQYINLILAMGIFFLVGGYGVNRSESEG